MSMIQKRSLLLVGLLLIAFPSVAQHGIHADWSSPIVLPDADGIESGAVGNNIAVAPDGSIYVMFNVEYFAGGRAIVWTRSTDNGVTWSTPVEYPHNQLGFIGTIAFSREGRLHLAYIDRVPDLGVYYSYSDDGAQTWTMPVKISLPPRHASLHSPYLTVDLKNRVHVAWHDGDPNVAGDHAEVFYRRSIDKGATWDDVQLLSADDNRHSAFPRFNFQDAAGDTLAMVWRDERTDDNWEVYAAVSADGGASWTEKLVAGGNGDQWDPESLITPDGTIHVGVMEYPLGVSGAAPPRLYYIQSHDLGETWTSPVQLSENRSRFPHLLYDARHGAVWYTFKDERDFEDPLARHADVVGKYSTDNGLTWSTLEFGTDEGDQEVGLQGYAVGPDGGLHVNYVLHTEDTQDPAHLRYIQRSPLSTSVAVEDGPTLTLDLGEAYPNPAASRVTWPVEGGMPAPASITVYDLLGRVVRTKQVQRGEAGLHLDTAMLTPGVYIGRIQIGPTTYVRRFVVLR